MLKLIHPDSKEKIDSQDELDLESCLNEAEFKQLYQTIRKKRKN